jgi:site-specific DNA-methyltransferase (adenine-specific)
MEGMRAMPDNAFDLAIVDPPYGIDINHNIGRRKGCLPSNYKPVTWDSTPPAEEYFEQLFRVSKNQIVWGANHFISRMPKDSPCWVMWDKGFSQDVSFAQFELAWTSSKTTCKKFDKHPGQIDRIHPTQKPVALYKWLLANYAKEGQTILDTHLGSGSIAIACHYFGAHLTATEIDPDYFAAAVERIQRETQQIELFPPAPQHPTHEEIPLL